MADLLSADCNIMIYSTPGHPEILAGIGVVVSESVALLHDSASNQQSEG